MAVALLAGITVTPLARCAVALLLLPVMSSATAPHPFAWLQPGVMLDAATRDRLDRGEVIVRVLPAVDAELGIFAAARLNADGEMLAAWAGSIAQLKKSPYVLMVSRFSDPPVLDDLQRLALDDTDLDTVRGCRPGACDLKIPADDIVSLRQTAEAGGALWKEAVQRQFRRVVLNRLNAYQVSGFAGLPPYADRRKLIDPKAAFGLLLGRSQYLTSDAFGDADIESFFYWSKEQYGTGKPVISITHVDIVRPRGPSEVRVALVSREILATHYRNASLGLTAVTEDDSGQHYLVYVNRSQLDVLGGLFGGLKRAIVEGKLKNESAGVLNEVRRRLESGPPPGSSRPGFGIRDSGFED
jgi:hypothetical protein